MSEKIYFGTEKKRYETKGVQSNVPVEYRFILWQLIDALKDEMTIDYLQVFQFSSVDSSGNITEKIVHTQEEPDYSITYEFPTASLRLDTKVYVIDDGEQCTMMLAEEY